MEVDTLLAGLDFSRTRLLNTLDAIEKGGKDMREVLAWRPGPGRAHIGWQAMHCAATHDKYLNANLKSGKPRDEARVATFGGGSTPSDQQVPDLPAIRTALETEYGALREYVRGLAPQELGRKLANGRTVGESILLLAWHEAHHQGQIHLTWNLYKQAHGMT
jgi:hypothetical protein